MANDGELIDTRAATRTTAVLREVNLEVGGVIFLDLPFSRRAAGYNVFLGYRKYRGRCQRLIAILIGNLHFQSILPRLQGLQG